MPSDSDANTGVGTPITPGVGTGLSLALPLKPTLLSLPYYARIMGINPVHFQGAAGDDVWPAGGVCGDVWPRYSWQYADRVSHEDLARVIYDAEEDIARLLGYYPAPKWVAQEIHDYPRHYRRDLYQRDGLNLRGQRKSVRLRWGKFIQAGQRATTLVGTATTTGGSLAYTDEDGDGFAETATITLATTLTDVCEIKVYHTNTSADPGWEIRPARSKSISGGNVTMVFDSWLFIDPDLQAAHPTQSGFSAIDVSTTANYVTSVDVYREYNDFTATSAVFYWQPTPANLSALTTCTTCGGTGCVACSLSSQDGCMHVRNTQTGDVVPVPATYDSDDSQWDQQAFSICRDPDEVSLYYYAGEYNERWLDGSSCEALSNYWAHAIAWLATARLERPFCSCGNVLALADHLREDLARTGEVSYQVSFDLLSNPLGTKRGEVQAWQRIAKINGRQLKGGAI